MCEKVVIIPGIGIKEVDDEKYWYETVAKALRKENIPVVCKAMPDYQNAREKVWVPHMKNSLKCDEKTIVIGHSSGACATMRFLENNKLYGCVLVAPSISHQNIPKEINSGYFNRSWLWSRIKKNCNWILQFSSTDDYFVNYQKEQLRVYQRLRPSAILKTFSNRCHFNQKDFPEVVQAVLQRVTRVGNKKFLRYEDAKEYLLSKN